MGEIEKVPDQRLIALRGSTMFLIVAVILHPAHSLGFHLFRSLGFRHPADCSDGFGMYMLLLAGLSSLCYGVFFFWQRRRGAWQFLAELVLEAGMICIWPVY